MASYGPRVAIASFVRKLCDHLEKGLQLFDAVAYASNSCIGADLGVEAMNVVHSRAG